MDPVHPVVEALQGQRRQSYDHRANMMVQSPLPTYATLTHLATWQKYVLLASDIGPK
jgi:hypothetical protein